MRHLRIVIALLACLGVFSLFIVPNVASAYDVFDAACSSSEAKATSPTCASRTDSNPLTGPDGMLMRVTYLIATIAGFTAIIVIILSGGRYMMAGGDTQKATSARNSLIGALVGLVIITLSGLIITFVISRIE